MFTVILLWYVFKPLNEFFFIRFNYLIIVESKNHSVLVLIKILTKASLPCHKGSPQQVDPYVFTS